MHSLPSEITELAQDAVGSAFAAGTHSNITVTYDDATNKISLSTGPDVITQTSLSNTLTNATTGYVPIGDVGNADGVASLDSNGFIPDSEIPAAIARDSELSSHTSATTTVHGIADTSALATKAYADNAASTAASALVASAPSTLNTLNELATALGNDASFSTTISTALGNKEPLLPSQSGNSGKFLTTDGTTKSWAIIQQYSLPSQASNSGKYLTTNGSVESWATISIPGNATASTAGVVLGITPSGNGDTSLSLGQLTGIGGVGSANVCIGYGTGYFMNGGVQNTFIGVNAGGNNSDGSDNVKIGHAAGDSSNTTSSVAIGKSAGTNQTGSNVITIGAGANSSLSTTSNQITLGNSSITTFRIPGLAVNWTTSAYGRATYASTSAPSGGADGDVWLVYTA
jgi:hypothetical protein